MSEFTHWLLVPMSRYVGGQVISQSESYSLTCCTNVRVLMKQSLAHTAARLDATQDHLGDDNVASASYPTSFDFGPR